MTASLPFTSALRLSFCARCTYNPPILALLAPPALVHLTLMEAEAASQVIHAGLRAAGPRIRMLVLDFWRDSPITQLATCLTTGLRTIHIRAPNFTVWT
jgi:hypothetical protein